jgi:hypothetical protein
MKAFISGVLLMVVISVIAWAALDQLGMSAGDVFTSKQSVRL